MINPAYAGTQKILNATLFYRKQWWNIQGSPNTQAFSVHSPLPIKKKQHIGLGLVVVRDQINIHENYAVFTNYSYKFVVGRKNIVSLGLSAGFNHLFSDPSRLVLTNPIDPLFVTQNAFTPNFGAGLYYYKNNRGFAGISVPQLVKNRLLIDDLNRKARESRYYFLTGGYVFDLNKTFKIKPSALVRIEEKAPINMDLSGMLIINEFIFTGISYRSSFKTERISIRSSESISFISQIQLNENFQIGYGFDLPLSALNKYSYGSHEFLLNYRFNLTREKCKTYL